ncbi:MAG TPA: helix-turn-helix domain-containing protein [Thermoanaerobaculia bacterium]|nr:helix-turn-helix domain-containing protein [Thermoanaerobaculia bacterium]
MRQTRKVPAESTRAQERAGRGAGGRSQSLNSQTLTSQSLPVLMTPDQVADLLMVSPRTLAGWRLRGEGPRFVRLGNKGREMIRYRSSVILAWIEAHERQATEGAAEV